MDLESRIRKIVSDKAVLNVLLSLLKNLLDAIEDAGSVLPDELIEAALKPLKLVIQRIEETINLINNSLNTDFPDADLPNVIVNIPNLENFISPIATSEQVIVDMAKELAKPESALQTAMLNILDIADASGGGGGGSPITPVPQGAITYGSGFTETWDELNLFYDTTNKFLGIGNNNPVTRLDVSGAITLRETPEPDNPIDGRAVLWLSSDPSTRGSVFMKINIDGDVFTKTIVDFSEF